MLAAQLYTTLCNHMNCNLSDCPWGSPGENTGVGSHSLPQGTFPTWDRTLVSCIAGRFFTVWATREAPKQCSVRILLIQVEMCVTCIMPNKKGLVIFYFYIWRDGGSGEGASPSELYRTTVTYFQFLSFKLALPQGNHKLKRVEKRQW